MQDEMNFGILSEHDMEQYLARPELSLLVLRIFKVILYFLILIL